jgi:hypothetical protein
MPEQVRWADFEKSIANEAAHWIKKFPPETNPELAKAMENHLFDLDGPTTIQRTPGRDEAYFWTLFRGFVEISDCVQRQHDIARYVGSFPYQSSELDRVRCLRYHIESYFHETYILRERLTAYATKIERAFRRDGRREPIQSATRSARATASATLTGVSNTRSSHVHQARFDPRNLSKLDLLRLLSQSKDLPKEVSEFYQFEFRRIRSEWQATLRRNNAEIAKLLDTIAVILTGVLVDSQRKRFKYPRASTA